MQVAPRYLPEIAVVALEGADRRSTKAGPGDVAGA